jgi:hypothetical protein
MTPEELTSRIAPLYSAFINLAALTDNKRPLHLAHYTSLDVLEKITQTNEIWFSNPLFMNDHQEMRFVLFEAVKVIAEWQNDKDALSLVECKILRKYLARSQCVSKFRRQPRA